MSRKKQASLAPSTQPGTAHTNILIGPSSQHIFTQSHQHPTTAEARKDSPKSLTFQTPFALLLARRCPSFFSSVGEDDMPEIAESTLLSGSDAIMFSCYCSSFDTYGFFGCLVRCFADALRALASREQSCSLSYKLEVGFALDYVPWSTCSELCSSTYINTSR